jgi:hypothetical protein
VLNFPSATRQPDPTGTANLLAVESPHYQFRNLLYVSPKELNFSNRSGGDRARNIAVKVTACNTLKLKAKRKHSLAGGTAQSKQGKSYPS